MFYRNFETDILKMNASLQDECRYKSQSCSWNITYIFVGIRLKSSVTTFSYQEVSLHKKWSFQLRISSVNVTIIVYCSIRNTGKKRAVTSNHWTDNLLWSIFLERVRKLIVRKKSLYFCFSNSSCVEKDILDLYLPQKIILRKINFEFLASFAIIFLSC